MDKFPDDAAKIIDQLESILLGGGGGGGRGTVGTFQSCKEHELLMITAIRSIRRSICNFKTFVIVCLLLTRMTHAIEY